MELTVKQLAQALDAELTAPGDTEVIITAVGPVDIAGPQDVTFINHNKHIPAVQEGSAGAVIIAQAVDGLSCPQLVVKNVDVAVMTALRLFAPQVKSPAAGIDPSARIGQDVHIGEDVSIGSGVVIEDGVTIGAHTVLAAGCFIGAGCSIGENCRFDSHVVVYHHCSIGQHVMIQANSTIGAIGFGYAFIEGAHQLFPHNGGVIIEDFVDIGANCCIDRAKFTNTIVGAGTKMDNCVQIGHNVVIGKCCLISALVGIGGSARLGDGVVLGGQVGIADNISLGEGTMVGAQAGVMNNSEPGERLMWSPAMDAKQAFRLIAEIQRLPKMSRQLKRIIKRMERLEVAEDDTT